MKAEVTGLDAANDKLTAELRKVGRLSERFVTKALISVSANTAPMVPIDTSFLINSEYRKVTDRFGGFEGELGYGANYAPYVHEAPGTLKGEPRANGNGDYWDPDGEPQFLAKGVDAFIAEDMDAILRQEFGE